MFEYKNFLRDMAALAALQAFQGISTENDVNHDFFYSPEDIASRCYYIADAMVEEKANFDD